MSFTVNNFVSTLVGGANSGSATISVSSGHTVVVVIEERNFTGLATGTLTDSAGNTYSVGKSVTSNVYISTAFYSIGIASPITSVTYTTGTPSTNAFLIYVWDVTATGTIAFADAQAVIGASTTGANGITTGSMAVTSADALLLAAMKDWSSGAITAGTGFTHDSSVEDFGEHRAVTASAAATFTDATGGNDYGAAGLALQVASAAPATTLAWQPIRPLSPPGSLPGKLGRFYQSPKSYAVATNVTAALTGQAATFAAGTPTPGTSVAATGQAATFSAGTVTPATSIAVTGQAATFAAGTVTPSSSISLTGQAATFAAGLLTPSTSLALTGQAGTFAAGTLSPSTAVLLTGQVATFGAGTMTTGNDVTVSLAGQASAFTAGILAPNTALALSGGAASFAAGNLLATPTVGLTGQSGAFTAGTLSPSSAIALTGLQASFSAGLLGVVGDVTVALSGQSATFAAGLLTAPAVSTGAGPVDSPRIAEGHYRKKRAKVRRDRVEQPVFIAPASLESIPQPVIDRVPNFTALSQTLGESPAALSARIDREIEFLMRAQAERDDEDALVWILRALEQLPPD